MTYAKRGILVRLIYLLIAIFFLAMRKIIGAKNGTVVICYHGVKDHQRRSFLKQLSMIKNRIVSTRNISQDINILSICITFDDAFVNLLENVIPDTTEMEIPIAIFIPAGNLGTRPRWLQGSRHSDSSELIMTANQLLSLGANTLVTLGSHTIDHPRLSFLKEEKIREQLRNSRNIINQITGQKVTELALPHGDYNDAVLRIALEEGYTKIYTLEPLINDLDNSNSGSIIGRFSVSPDDWPIEFYLTINGSYAWLEQWRSLINKIKTEIFS